VLIRRTGLIWLPYGTRSGISIWVCNLSVIFCVCKKFLKKIWLVRGNENAGKDVVLFVLDCLSVEDVQLRNGTT